jgi:hypothetical protein
MPALQLGVYAAPMLATTADAIPAGNLWAAELKWDGARIQAHVEGERAFLHQAWARRDRAAPRAERARRRHR